MNNVNASYEEKRKNLINKIKKKNIKMKYLVQKK